MSVRRCVLAKSWLLCSNSLKILKNHCAISLRREETKIEHPRVPGKVGAAGIRRAGAARDRGVLGRGGGGGGAPAGGADLGGQGADPRRWPRQGRGRQSRVLD